MKMLNLGCGDKYHPAWINIDFVSNDKNVIAHNLLKGIPFGDNEVDVVYHAHVLEHFSPEDGKKFVKECFRVLKPGGILRVAVPDLENIILEYLRNLKEARTGDKAAAARYEWIKLELLDQMVRHHSGGNCGKYFFQENMPAEDYVYERWGETARIIRKAYKKSANATIMERIHWKLTHPFWKKDNEITRVGKFRLSGESHLWMYESYSLGLLMQECGFIEPKVLDAFISSIKNWKEFQLEEENGVILKPDTLVMEATKP